MSRAVALEVAAALSRRQEDLVEGLVAQAVVTAVGTNTVTVRFPGGAAGSDQTWPRLRSYGDAKVNDVAILLGRPGSWVALGALA